MGRGPETLGRYSGVDPDDRSLLLLRMDKEGNDHELPPESPFEIHPGGSLQLEIAPLFV